MAEWQDKLRQLASRVASALANPNPLTPGSRAETNVVVPRTPAGVLRRYYDNNALYAAVQTSLAQQGTWTEALLPIRNPAHASVEFFASTLWGDLQIITESPAVEQAVQQVWLWSNWQAMQPVSARWSAIYGDLFLKVASSPSRVNFQLLPVETIGDNFETDDRGIVTWCRIDTPQADNFVFTEVWDLTGYRAWRHQLGGDVAVDRLGTPLSEITLAQMGIDFIPVVHSKFMDLGDRHGVGAFAHALDPIDEADRSATRLHEILFQFNKPLWVVTHDAKDQQGRPIPPISTAALSSTGDDRVVSLPGGGQFQSLVPDIRYADALAILNAHLDYIKTNYLPELAWYDTKADANTSGRAIRLSLTAAVARAEEARKNLDAALIRADNMALTLGVNAGLFRGIGSYEIGSFEHSFAPRPVIPADGLDQATEATAWTAAGVPISLTLKHFGWPEEEVAAIEAAKTASLADAMARFNAGA